MARRADDDRGVGQAGWELLLLHRDRISAWVRAFDFEGRGQIVPPDDRDDVEQDAVRRGVRAHRNFEGHQLNQWRASLKKATYFAAADHMRKHITREMRLKGSFDEKAYDDADAGRFDGVVATWPEDLDDRIDARERFAHILDEIADLPNPDHRAVLIMTMDGHTSKAIADTIGKSPDNVDQMRRRGIKALEKLHVHDR